MVSLVTTLWACIQAIVIVICQELLSFVCSIQTDHPWGPAQSPGVLGALV